MKKLAVFLSVSFAFLIASVAQAHAADMYFHTHLVTLSPNGVQIVWEIAPGAMIAQGIWQDADQDGDGIILEQEALAWANVIFPAFQVTLDEQTLALTCVDVDWPVDIPALASGEEPIRIHLEADWPTSIEGSHWVTLRNRYNPKNSISWYEVRGKSGIVFRTPEQNRGRLHLEFGPSDWGEHIGTGTRWESGSPTIPKAVESLGLGEIAAEAQSQNTPGARSAATSILEGFLRKQESSLVFLLAAQLIAALLGMLHALSPGHGKTIVAAYLVGSQGRFHHAAVLGLVVTLTHTGSVFILGLLSLAASRYFLAADILPMLELVSGVLILALGIGLLLPRLWQWRDNKQRQRQMEKAPVEARLQPDGGRRLVINRPIEEPGPPHSHDPSAWGHIPKGAQTSNNPFSEIRWRSLVTLGVSGGLVPCPDAIAILLIAITLNRIALGLSLIVSFSMGLALLLIAIGVLMLQGKRLFERLQWFDRAAFIVPVLSALVVLGIGTALTIGAVGNLSAVPAQMNAVEPADAAPVFDLEQAGVVYAAPDENGKSQLFLVPASGGEPRQITDEADGVWEYTITPEGAAIIYSTANQMETDLWRLNLADSSREDLLKCPNAFCSDLVWSSDEGILFYSRLELDAETNASGVSSIWWLDLIGGETAPLFQDEQMPGYNPRWSFDGKWFSYTTINPVGIKIYNLESGDYQLLPTQNGSPVAWSPNADDFLMIDIHPVGSYHLSKLFRYNPVSQELKIVDSESMLDENYPAWSPNGEWIAVVRRDWGAETLQRGNQIWLLRPDGTEAHPVTRNQDAYHGQPVWSPDGKYLLYPLNLFGTEEMPTEIHVLEIETGRDIKIASPGGKPAWLHPFYTPADK